MKWFGSKLRELLRRGAETAGAGPDEELTGAILSRTSGSPCVRARTLLCELIDGELARDDVALLRLHVQHCLDCLELDGVLRLLGRELPEMADVPPDPRFMAEVLRVTTHRHNVFSPPAWTGWRSLLSRPRIAWEGAYVGAMLIGLLFAAPTSPLRDVPPRALATLRGEGPPTRLAASFSLSPLTGPLEQVASNLRGTVEPMVDEAVVTAGSGLAASRARIEARGKALVDHVRRRVAAAKAALRSDARETESRHPSADPGVPGNPQGRQGGQPQPREVP